MRNMIQSSALLLFLLLAFTNIYAQTKPTPESTLSVLNFYFNGQGQGVILADMKVCETIEENECVENIPANALKKDEQYMIWMMYVVPRGDEALDPDHILLRQ